MHNIVHSPVAHAPRINQQHDLSTILIGLLDEIFQAARSRLGGGRCQIHLLLLAESRRASRRRYLGHPAAGTGRPRLRSRGHNRRFRLRAPRRASGGSAWVPCRGDVFHALHAIGPLVRYLENRAYEAIDARTKLERKQAAADVGVAAKTGSGRQLSYARPAEAKAIALADEVALLARWLRNDILSVAGSEYAIRRDLFDFVVAELRAASRLVRIGSSRL